MTGSVLLRRDGAMVEPGDIERILASAHDYVEGWFEGDAERLGRSLHPDVRKRAVSDHASGGLELDELDVPPWLARTRQRGPIADISRECEYVVLDVFRDIATCLILSEPFMDYLHLARFGGRWLIVNVLYEER